MWLRRLPCANVMQSCVCKLECEYAGAPTWDSKFVMWIHTPVVVWTGMGQGDGSRLRAAHLLSSKSPWADSYLRRHTQVKALGGAHLGRVR